MITQQFFWLLYAILRRTIGAILQKGVDYWGAIFVAFL
jgi:hypothetical protein